MGHGLLSFLFVLFLEAQTERGLTFEHIYRLDLIFPRTGSVKYLADDVPHLLSVDDVRGVDDGRVAGPVHLSSLLVLSLEKWIPKPSMRPLIDKIATSSNLLYCELQKHMIIQTWLRMSVAFLALMKSGVSVAKANIPLPLISCSSAFLYSLCKCHGGYYLTEKE